MSTTETVPTETKIAGMRERIRGAGTPEPDRGDDPAPSPEPDQGDERAPFQRKSWDELSESYRRELERRGQTRERHDAGHPPPRPKDTAPKRGKGRPRTAEAPKDTGPKRPTLDQLRGEVHNTVGRIGFAVSLVDRFDGLVILANAEAAADAAISLAEVNPSVRRTLERLTEVSGYAALATVGAQIAVPILMHHRIIPASPLALRFLGVPDQAIEVDPDLMDPPDTPAEPEPARPDDDETPTATHVADPEGSVRLPFYDPEDETP